MKNVTIGADPEVFVKNNGNIVSAIGMIGGTKDNPIRVDRGALQEDNILAEFNIDPAQTKLEFLRNIRTVMNQLEKKVAPMKLEVLSSAQFTPQFLQLAGAQAMVFGCDPDYNAWTGEVNQTPSPFTTMRTAGGHIHVGFEVDEDDMETRANVIRMMDFYLGVPSVLFDPDAKRRALYGKAGAFRPKEYGVEYRTLSNFWIGSDSFIQWAYTQAQDAVNDVDKLEDMLKEFNPEVVQTTINESDFTMAGVICKELDINLETGA